MMTRFISASLIIFSLVLQPFASFGTPMPDEVDEILMQLEEFEENFESANWDGAGAILGVISGEIRRMLEQSRRQDEYLEKLLTDLSQYVIEENEKLVEVHYLRFKKQFFQFISGFEYEVHPLLEIIRQYVVEDSTEAYANRDYTGVISEMREVGNLIAHARPQLMEKGIAEKEIDAFRSRVIGLIIAGNKEEYEKMGDLLEQVRKQYNSLLTRYHQ